MISKGRCEASFPANSKKPWASAQLPVHKGKVFGPVHAGSFWGPSGALT